MVLPSLPPCALLMGGFSSSQSSPPGNCNLVTDYSTFLARGLLGIVSSLVFYSPQAFMRLLTILQVFYSVDPDQPVGGGVGLLQVVQLDVLVANLNVASPIKSRGGTK